MTPSQPSARIIWLDSAESTNKSIREAISALDNLSVIAAAEQTAGRGQGTHTWHSRRGENLTFSILLRPQELEVPDILLLTCATTLGIRDYLLDNGVESRIKWPNDIWVGDRKICGILIENILDGKLVKESIIGIGLNINQCEWPEELPNPVSLKQLTGRTYRPDKELGRLAEKLCRRFSQMDSETGRVRLQEDFGKNVFRLPEERPQPLSGPDS